MMSPLRMAFQLACPGGDSKLSILIFHRVLPEQDPIFPDETDGRRFSQIMGWVRTWFNVIPLDAAVEALKTRNLPARAMAITFDDGYADNRTIALPILKQHGLSATFFVATGYLDGGRMWNDTIIEAIRGSKARRLVFDSVKKFEGSRLQSLAIGSVAEKRAAIQAILGRIKYLSSSEREAVSRSIAEQCDSDLPDNLMMTTQQVVEMRRAGMLIGAHTMSHPILAKLEPVEVRKEISGSKKFLESILEEEVSLFAYPNGRPGLDFQTNDATIVKELGFQAAVTTAWGVARTDSDLMQLPRFTPWDKSRVFFGTRLIKNTLQNQGPSSSQISN
ncbi:MAG: polysaccharide deacetylase family protein [Ignavibacteria bacterium]|nr:polysaccharide deacetylase family protein [Ignavibacteria bacterium]